MKNYLKDYKDSFDKLESKELNQNIECSNKKKVWDIKENQKKNLNSYWMRSFKLKKNP